MPSSVLSDFSIVLTFLRAGQGWSQAQLGKAAGLSPSQINDYEKGRRPLSRKRLEILVSRMGLAPAAVEETLARLAAYRTAFPTPPEPGDVFAERRRRIESVSAKVGGRASEFIRSVLSLLTVEGEILEGSQRADLLWSRLQRRSPEMRTVLVEHTRKYQDWALCVRVAAESIAAAPNHPRQALELAELSRRIAERVPGSRAWQQRLQGYSWAHVGNARRVCNDLPGADEAMKRAWTLWEAGEPGDPGLLNAAWLPVLDASLRRDQRRFREALKRIEEALALDPGELRGKILLAKANIHDALGDPGASTAALHEADSLIDERKEPRLALVLRFNLMVDLCGLERTAEAAVRLPEVRHLAERLGEELDLVRVVWLEGKVAAGRGKISEALAAFHQARSQFAARELAYDYALVSLELACLLLEQGRAPEVRSMAGETLWIFRSQGIHREALAALHVFWDAVQQEAATAELAHRVIRFLYRAQHDPGLRFEEAGA